MAVNSETEINLKTLQRVDSNIVEIIDNASQVAIYKYERKLNKWEGTDIEGTLFLYKRSLYPFHGFIIVNRMSTTNFIEPITSDMEILLQEPYFLYKTSCGDIIGSWFYEHGDFRRITNKIQRIVLKQSSPPRRQRCSSDSDSQLKKDEAVQDIMTLLSEAHNEYINSEINISVGRNIEEDFNDLATYTDKKMNNKSLNTPEKKLKYSCLRSSSEEKYPISPRRRFLSAGSYDSTSSLSCIPNKVLNMIVSKSKEINKPSELGKMQNECKEFYSDSTGVFPFAAENLGTPSAPTRLSPLFSQDEISSPTLCHTNALKESTKPPNYQKTSELHFTIPVNSNVIPKATSSDYMPKNRTKKSEYEQHSSDLKHILLSHLEDDSDIVLKIHEAYVASLKSLFMHNKG